MKDIDSTGGIKLVILQELMGRPIRVALSKRFLREETKAAIQPEGAKEDEV